MPFNYQLPPSIHLEYIDPSIHNLPYSMRKDLFIDRLVKKISPFNWFFPKYRGYTTPAFMNQEDAKKFYELYDFLQRQYKPPHVTNSSEYLKHLAHEYMILDCPISNEEHTNAVQAHIGGDSYKVTVIATRKISKYFFNAEQNYKLLVTPNKANKKVRNLLGIYV